MIVIAFLVELTLRSEARNYTIPNAHGQLLFNWSA